MTALYNLIGGWAAILLGCLAGAAQGLFFDREDWLGGYGSWRRRMLRLGHIAFVGLGFLNIAMAGTSVIADVRWQELSSALLLAGLCAMPTVCYLSALRRGFRHLFLCPAICVIAGVCTVLGGMLWRSA